MNVISSPTQPSLWHFPSFLLSGQENSALLQAKGYSAAAWGSSDRAVSFPGGHGSHSNLTTVLVVENVPSHCMVLASQPPESLLHQVGRGTEEIGLSAHGCPYEFCLFLSPLPHDKCHLALQLPLQLGCFLLLW